MSWVLRLIPYYLKYQKSRRDASNMAWMCRASFEHGYRAANGWAGKDEWRQDWRDSQPRATLSEMGYVNEGDDWR